jgi:hypothetical protein
LRRCRRPLWRVPPEPATDAEPLDIADDRADDAPDPNRAADPPAHPDADAEADQVADPDAVPERTAVREAARAIDARNPESAQRRFVYLDH